MGEKLQQSGSGVQRICHIDGSQEAVRAALIRLKILIIPLAELVDLVHRIDLHKEATLHRNPFFTADVVNCFNRAVCSW